MGEFSHLLSKYLWEKSKIEAIFLSEYINDWIYYFSNGIQVYDIKDQFDKIPLKRMKLKFFSKYNLDVEKILKNNYVRYKRLGAKTINSNAFQDYYYSSFKFLDAFFARIPVRNLPRPLISLFYRFSRLMLKIFRKTPKKPFFIKWKKIIQNFNIVSYLNKRKDFKNVARVSLQYFFGYYLFLKKKKPDMVLIYNGNWIMNTTLRAACQKLEIPCYFLETTSFIGYSHFDSTSVWYDGDINRIELKPLNKQEKEKLKKWIERYFQKYNRGIATLAETDDQIIQMLPKNKFIFVPLQIIEDINSTVYSPLIHSMLHLVKEIIKACPPGYDIVFKRHPWDSIWEDDLYHQDLKKIKEIAKKYDYIHIYHHVHPKELLKRCSAFITINSTMGMENILTIKAPTVILGDSFIRGWGFTYDVINLEELPAKIQDAINIGVTTEMYNLMEQFAYAYIFDFIVHGHYKLLYPIYNEKGKLIKYNFKDNDYYNIAKKIIEAKMQIKERIKQKKSAVSPPIQNYKCFIDRSKIKNYKKIII